MSVLHFNTARQDDNALGKLARDFKEANPKEINALGKLARDFKEANPKEIQSEVLSHRVASLKEGKLDREGEKKMNVLLEKYRKKAVEEGIEKGIEKGMQQGQNRLALLVGQLLNAGRMDDLKRVSFDEDYREKLLKEFGL
ncbi:hypothetical protein [Oribacterium sinus]